MKMKMNINTTMEYAAIKCMIKRYKMRGYENAIKYFEKWCKRMPNLNHNMVLKTFENFKDVE